MAACQCRFESSSSVPGALRPQKPYSLLGNEKVWECVCVGGAGGGGGGARGRSIGYLCVARKNPMPHCEPVWPSGKALGR